MKKVNQKQMISNAILWAAAIIASALLGSSEFLTIIILPTLALLSLGSITLNSSKKK